MTTGAAVEPERGLILRFTIWFTSTWLGQRIYVRAVPPIDRWLMLWSRGRRSLSPSGDPEGLGGLALLTTTGARSGKRRHTPLGFAWDGDSIVILASNAARSFHPTWYFNLKKHPEVEILVRGGRQGRYRAAEIPPGPERERLWKVACAMNPGFERYPARTGGRIIPVIHCTPISAR
jgi:deazaflavin-dependent oxidoreductase (nitroreductase family)